MQPVSSFQSLLPVQSHRTHLFPPAMSCGNVCNAIYQGSSLENHHPGFFLGGAGPVGTLYLAYTKSQTSRRKWVFIINHNVCTDSLDMVGHSYQGIVRTFREPKFAHANEGPILQARLSKDSGLRPAMLTLPAQLCYLRVNANLRA